MNSLKTAFRFLCFLALIGLLYSCASIGSPSGGPRDEEPPRPTRFSPPQGAVNVTSDKMEIDFNEIVTVKDAFSKVVVSPYQTSTARVISSGRKVMVEFTDSLLPNTTYTVDFADCIQDNNEGNKINSFFYTFSTGPYIDTLRISGTVLSARDLEPQQSMLVGIHSVLEDSAFRTLPFVRMAKTDDRGRFSIRGVAPGNYRVFALADVNGDVRWDNPEEMIAFYDGIVSPSAENVMVADTIYNMTTGQVDTVMSIPSVRFLPDDLLLFAFNTDFKPQYIVNNSRPDSTQLSLIFNAKNKSLPRLRLLGEERAAKNWYSLERSLNNDTLTYWITDPNLISQDTIRVALDYTAEIRPHVDKEISDTLSFIYKRIPVKKSDSKKDGKGKTKPFMNVSVSASSTLDVNTPVNLLFSELPVRLDSSAFRVERLVDTTWVSQPDIGFRQTDSLNPRSFTITNKWIPGGQYRIVADSLAAQGISGLFTDKLHSSFTVRKLDEYASLAFNIHGIPSGVQAFAELLSGDRPVRVAPVEGNTVTFPYILPGNYFARLFLDYNGNGEYDTGDYDLQIQPEDVFYYPKKIRVKKFWDMEQSWDINSLPADMQKPDDIKKNKPNSDKRSRRNQTNTQEEDEDSDYFDPTANPFDPNDRKNRRRNSSSYY